MAATLFLFLSDPAWSGPVSGHLVRPDRPDCVRSTDRVNGVLKYTGDIEELLDSLKQDVAFYEQSVRRDPLPEENASLVKIKSGSGAACTSFLIRGGPGRYFVGTAKHCFRGVGVEQTCRLKDKVFQASDGTFGNCKQIIAQNKTEEDDLVILELEFEKTPLDPRPLRLASIPRPNGTRIQTFGFPADRKHSIQATVTENCWISKTVEQSPYLGKVKDKAAFTPGRWIFTNCSNNPGNSGGPVVLDSTDLVIGTVLYSRTSHSYNYRPPEEALDTFTLWDDFIKTHRSTLAQNGIIIVDTLPKNESSREPREGSHDYLASMKPGTRYAGLRQDKNYAGSTYGWAKKTGNCAWKLLASDINGGTLTFETTESPIGAEKRCAASGTQLTFRCGRFPNTLCESDGLEKFFITRFEPNGRFLVTEGRDRAEIVNVFGAVSP